MEYSKEDLMEAKKQIWGVGENMGTEESKKIWEENAQFWDNAMGDESMMRTAPAGRTLRFITALSARLTCPNNRPTYPTQWPSVG